MNAARIDPATRRKPLRLWPGVVLVVLQWLARFGLPVVKPGFEGFELGMMGGLIGAAAILVWWAFFSRASHWERWGAMALMVAAMAATVGVNHESMGPLWFVGYAVPVLCLALVGWAVATRRLPDRARRVAMVATLVIACGVWALVRSPGINGDHVAEFEWRWSETGEDRLLTLDGDEPVALEPEAEAAAASVAAEPLEELVASAEAPAPELAVGSGVAEVPVADLAEGRVDWPGFRGPGRDGVVHSERIATDWVASPPVELWRRPVGAGWSSFAVHGDLLYTQEQRGDDEVVSCYRATTGQPVWRHRDAVRFFEANAGAGPRATPTVSGGRVYAFGATGILNALDAGTGALVWLRDVAFDTGVEIPAWGFSSSPLVVGGTVVVAAAGQLAAYDLATGEPRWTGPDGGAGYSSPQLVTLAGVPQILLMSETGAISVAPIDGAVFWEHPWPGYPIVQPALTAEGDLLISASQRSGTRRIALAHHAPGHGAGSWTVEERWTTDGLKPYFNDFVVHEGHAYGFDGRILACIGLDDGQRTWKGGRYGSGQLVLLPEQDLLLVLSEEGELALVAATPEGFTELARMPAIEGKTWNHPVVVGDLLLVRNGQEMVAFRLALAEG